jgi:hypothetical protein
MMGKGKREKIPEAVPQAYNLSYLGGKNKEDCGLRPTWAKSQQDLISTNKSKAMLHVSVISAMQEV